MHETAIFPLPLLNLTSPTCSSTRFPFRRGNFGDSAINMGVYSIFFIAHAWNGGIFAGSMPSQTCFHFQIWALMQVGSGKGLAISPSPKIVRVFLVWKWHMAYSSARNMLGHTPEYISDLVTSVANIPGRSTLCLKKNIPDVFSHNSRKHWRIFIIFGRNVTEKASNHMLLYFSTSPN